MSTTPILGITELAAAQAQPELVINEALRKLEAVAQLAAIDRDLATPPGSPADGDRYIVPPAATGAWSGQTNRVALNIAGTWHFLQPLDGWRCWLNDEQVFVQYAGGSPDGWF
jgi:hypothetical protein